MFSWKRAVKEDRALTRRRVVWLILVVVILLLALTGCSPQEMKPIDPNNGMWDRFFVYPLKLMMDLSAQVLFGSYGLAILAVTIIIRLLLLPLMMKQLRSMRMMQALQPEMQKIREKYKNDPQKMQEETMKLFQKHNVNPLSGCLPALIQMPILIAFYYAIMRSEEVRTHTFLWMNLGAPDPYYIMPVLAAMTTYLQSKVMGTTNNNPQAQLFLIIMPAMILFIAITLPSALSLYWVFSNLFTIVQTLVLKWTGYLQPQEGAAK